MDVVDYDCDGGQRDWGGTFHSHDEPQEWVLDVKEDGDRKEIC